MKNFDTIALSIALVIVILVVVVFGVLSCNANAGFCKRYFPGVPTIECMISSKYKYDGG